MRYDEYLKSDEWKARRAQARYRAKNRCEHCGGSPDHVHHVRYPKNFKDDVLENLIVVCESCHMKHHGIRGKEMTNALIVQFEGFDVCAVDVNGQKWARFADVQRVLGMLSSHWQTAQRELDDDEWELLTNPCTLQNEPFLSPDGVLIVGMRFGMNDKAKKLRKHLAKMAVGGRSEVKTYDEMDFLQGMLDGLKDAKKTAIHALAVSQKTAEEMAVVVGKLDGLENIANEFIRTSDYLRLKNSKLSDSGFGRFLSEFVRQNGGFLRKEVGWFSKTGEQLSKCMPAPDTQYGQINKWKKSLIEQAWPFFQRKVKQETGMDLFNA